MHGYILNQVSEYKLLKLIMSQFFKFWLLNTNVSVNDNEKVWIENILHKQIILSFVISL